MMDDKMLARFEAKFAVEPNTGCWLWLGRLDRHGYGKVDHGKKVGALAHRVAYEHYKGPIPEGMPLDHLCRQHCCINPDHLEPVTHRENMMRGESLWAVNSRKTHCLYGHAYDEANTARSPRGVRSCRACGKISQMVYAMRKKGEPPPLLQIAAALREAGWTVIPPSGATPGGEQP